MLVATTVIEVGVDVANATVMLVENAERFGLSQLHQLRGRVGRGEHRSSCLLVGPAGARRLRAMVEHADGFRLAEIDLELRDEGELVGTRQSGLSQFEVACLPRDAELLERARARAQTIVAGDPELREPGARAAGRGARAGVRRAGAGADSRVRVIAGRFGGRRLQAPKGRSDDQADVRPGAGGDLLDARRSVEGARVLDLFAGTGALGIEALSRGAARAVFVERDGAALAALRANLRGARAGRGARPRCGAGRRSRRCAVHERARRRTIWC